jgi:hypothetical protein
MIVRVNGAIVWSACDYWPESRRDELDEAVKAHRAAGQKVVVHEVEPGKRKEFISALRSVKSVLKNR